MKEEKGAVYLAAARYTSETLQCSYEQALQILEEDDPEKTMARLFNRTEQTEGRQSKSKKGGK